MLPGSRVLWETIIPITMYEMRKQMESSRDFPEVGRRIKSRPRIESIFPCWALSAKGTEVHFIIQKWGTWALKVIP